MRGIAAATFVTALLLVGCSSGAQEGAPAASGGGPAVAVDDFTFDPATASVAVGEEVTWTVAEGSSPHTVKFEDEESKQLPAGATYSRAFDKAGDYSYVCGIHPQMTGSVAVK